MFKYLSSVFSDLFLLELRKQIDLEIKENIFLTSGCQYPNQGTIQWYHFYSVVILMEGKGQKTDLTLQELLLESSHELMCTSKDSDPSGLKKWSLVA